MWIFPLRECALCVYFTLITNFKEKNTSFKSQISNIVLMEYLIVLGKKNVFHSNYLFFSNLCEYFHIGSVFYVCNSINYKFQEKKIASSKSQISNIVLVEYFILSRKKLFLLYHIFQLLFIRIFPLISTMNIYI